jgi:four helix bundle protein
VNYSDWLALVPEAITGDPLWKVEVYRLALFAADLGWHDVTRLMKDKRTLGLSDQLYRALGSIGGNVSEGYSRGTGKDRARFYEYALGSARESRNWYYNGRYVLGDLVANHRIDLLAQIIRLLLTMVPDQRGHFIEEEELPYLVNADSNASPELSELLQNVPLP